MTSGIIKTMWKILTVILLIVSLSNNSFAQSNNELAKASFLKAQRAYSEGNNETALKDIGKTVEYLGSTNAKIEGLYVKIHMALGNYAESKLHLEKYFKHADESRSDYSTMLSYVGKIKKISDKIETHDFSNEPLILNVNGKYSLVNKNGQRLNSRNYDLIDKFVEDRAAVKLHNKFGFINAEGKEITPLKYEKVYPFSQALAKVSIDSYYGMINKEGREVTPLVYRWITDFSDGIASAKISSPTGNEYYRHFIDTTGRIVLKTCFVDASVYSDGLVAVQSKMNYKWGYINMRGDIVIPCKFEGADTFNGDVSIVGIKYSDYPKQIKWAFINKKGDFISSLKYERAEGGFERFGFDENGIAPFKYNNRYGLINNQGKELVQATCGGSIVRQGNVYYCQTNSTSTVIYEFKDLKAEMLEAIKNHDFTKGPKVYKNGSKYILIDKKGDIIPSKRYSYIHEFSNNRAPVQLNDKWGYINEKGNEITPPKYDGVQAFTCDITGVRLNDKWCIINSEGSELTPFKYDGINGDLSQTPGVMLNDKLGVINNKGQEITPIKYDGLWPFSEGLAKVSLNETYGFVNKEGKEVIPLQENLVSDFSEGFAFIKIDNKWGYIDQRGDLVIPATYDDAYEFAKGEAIVGINGKHGRKYGKIDKKGKVIKPIEFEYSYFFKD